MTHTKWWLSLKNHRYSRNFRFPSNGILPFSSKLSPTKKTKINKFWKHTKNFLTFSLTSTEFWDKNSSQAIWLEFTILIMFDCSISLNCFSHKTISKLHQLRNSFLINQRTLLRISSFSPLISAPTPNNFKITVKLWNKIRLLPLLPTMMSKKTTWKIRKKSIWRH